MVATEKSYRPAQQCVVELDISNKMELPQNLTVPTIKALRTLVKDADLWTSPRGTFREHI